MRAQEGDDVSAWGNLRGGRASRWRPTTRRILRREGPRCYVSANGEGERARLLLAALGVLHRHLQHVVARGETDRVEGGEQLVEAVDAGGGALDERHLARPERRAVAAQHLTLHGELLAEVVTDEAEVGVVARAEHRMCGRNVGLA